MIEKFSELTECPFCGSSEYKIVKHLSYAGNVNVNFRTGERTDPFTPDQLEEKLGVRTYCANCNTLLGNLNDDKLSKPVRDKLAGN